MIDSSSELPYANIERLVTTEMRPHNMLQGYVRPLYEAARGDGPPITLQIAEAVAATPLGRVAIITGIYFDKHFPHGEIDGPIGAVALARALTRIGYQVDLLAEDPVMPVLERLTARLGIDVDFRSTSNRSSEEVTPWADDYVMAITVEKIGRASNGKRHSIMATPLPPGDDYIDDLVTAMTERGVLTIGLGDGGNEMGFGKIHDVVRKIVPRGEELGTVTATSIVFPAAVSNFGAYAICAALAVHRADQSLMVDPGTVIALIKDAVAEGCLDGGTVDPTFIGDDGIPEEGVASVVSVMNVIVRQWFGSFDRHF